MKSIILGLLMATGLNTVSMAQSSSPSLDDLEKKLEQRKASKNKPPAVKTQQNGDSASSPATEALVQQAEAPKLGALRSGKLLLDTNEACTLRVNGDTSGVIAPDQPKVFSVDSGQVLIECVSTQDQTRKVRQVQSVEVGKQLVLTLNIPAAASKDRFLDEGGNIKDTRTGLVWSKSDNGSDVYWEEATNICRRKSGNWSLPTQDELMSIYDTAFSVSCGQHTCHTSPKFQLTYFVFWSNQQKDSYDAWFVNLGNGFRNFAFSSRSVLGPGTVGRALCVLRS
jgi:hypothetical protein